ncbi:MAG: hypothetical protein WCO06_00890 [Candidatus Roizmanbacteria bacterium]
MTYQYPLKLSFKVLSFSPQIRVTDASGATVQYIEQKLFKLKEDVRVYRDDKKEHETYQIKADRIIDFSATYHIRESNTDRELGLVQRQGMKSIFKATYNIKNAMNFEFATITEANPWVKVFDSLVEQIPIVGMFSGYMFHPEYIVHEKNTGKALFSLKKEPAFLEGLFSITKLDPTINEDQANLIILSLMMLVLLERGRG